MSLRGVAVLPRLFLVTLLACCMLSVSTASAQDLKALYNEAKGDLKEARYTFALEKFKKGITLAGDDMKQAWRMMLGTAIAYGKMDQLENCVETYRVFLDSLSAHPDQAKGKWESRRKVVEEQVSAIEQEILEQKGMVDIRTTPPGAKILINGVAPGSEGAAVTPFAAFLRPGQHKVRLDLEGFRTVEVKIEVDIGGRKMLSKPLVAKARHGQLIVRSDDPETTVFVDGVRIGAGAEIAIPTEPGIHTVKAHRVGATAFEVKARVIEGQDTIVKVAAAVPAMVGDGGGEGAEIVFEKSLLGIPRYWGWVGVGSGAAFVATGAVFTILAAGDASDADALAKSDLTQEDRGRWDDLNASIGRNQIVAGVMYGLGGLAVAGGVTWLVLARDESGAKDSTQARNTTTDALKPSFSVAPSPGGGFATLRWDW